MIDNKKIEEAARICGSHFIGDNEDSAAQYGFKKGAHWAINEFLKKLWHSASERPKDVCTLLTEYEEGKYYVTNYDRNKNGWCNYKVIRWLYIDDLLPKKGGSDEKS